VLDPESGGQRPWRGDSAAGSGRSRGDTVEGFVADEALTRGAAIAYYTVFSLAPLLVIASAIAGFVFGEDAARGAVAGQLRGLLGEQAAEAVQAMVRGASDRASGSLAALLSVGTLLLTASGVFGELQSSLNAIWKTEVKESTVSRLLRAKAASIGLVAATGFLLLVSLLASAALAAFGTWLGGAMPGTRLLLQGLNLAVGFAMTAALFAAIYKILPDRRLRWRDVAAGAVATAFLFTVGKSLIGLYIGGTAVASTFGAMGALAVVLLWVFYSAQIFLLGAEFTRAWASQEGSRRTAPIGPRAAEAAPARRGRPCRRAPKPPRTGTHRRGVPWPCWRWWAPRSSAAGGGAEGGGAGRGPGSWLGVWSVAPARRAAQRGAAAPRGPSAAPWATPTRRGWRPPPRPRSAGRSARARGVIGASWVRSEELHSASVGTATR
jgi:membrane protein